MTDLELIALAEAAREYAYSPYSDYTVGAALLTEDGRVFKGSNLENASYSATLCAERSAFAQAISQGCRAFQAIAVVGGKAGQAPNSFFMPCGICRQVMREFCADDFRILVSDGQTIRSQTLAELLPGSFSADAMQK